MGRTVVALDLGSTGVRAAQFTLSKAAPKMTKVAFVPLPPGAISDGQVVDQAAVTAALKALWSSARFKTKQVLFAVANNDVLVRPADLDWHPPADFRKTLAHQAEEQIAMPQGENNVDFHAVREYDEQGPDGDSVRKVRALLVMAGTSMMDAYVTAISAAGLLPVQADLMPFALIRASRPSAAEDDAAEVVVEIGADITTVLVHQGGTPRFVRIIADRGGSTVTDALVGAFGWSAAEAEQTKIRLGLPSADAPAPQPIDSIFSSHATSPAEPLFEQPAYGVINQAVSALISEVRTTIQFFLTSSADVPRVNRVVLTGGGSLVGGLLPRMTSELGMRVEHGDPLGAITTAPSATLPPEITEQQMAVLVGLAMGATR